MRLLKISLRTRKKIAKYFGKHKDVVFMSFPKSGRTWLRVMLDRMNINLSYSHEESAYSKGISCENLDTDKSEYGNKRVIFLVRDPRDTVVSSYFQSVKRMKSFEGSISDYIRDERYGIKKIVKFHDIWYENRNVPKEFLLIRYVDIHEDTLGVLKNIINFLRIKNISEDRLRETVEFAKFENLQKLEEKGFFAEDYGSKLTPPDRNDKESYKVRKGKVGGYLDYLKEEDREFCNEAMRNANNPFYCADNSSIGLDNF